MEFSFLRCRTALAGLGLVAAAGVCLVAASVRAAEPEFVGVLSIAVDDQVAKELQLSDTQKRKLLELIDARENEVLELALKLKSAPPAERAQRLEPFRRESEEKGLALLTAPQRARLEAIRVSRQSGQPAKTAAGPEPAPAAGAPTKTIASGEPPAKTAAGPEPTPAAGAPTKTIASGEPPAKTAAGPEPVSAAKPAEAVAAPATATTAKPLTQVVAPAQPAGKLRFNFRFQPWKDVLDWFAQQAGLSLAFDNAPPGTFNYSDDRDYTPAEAIDLLNSVLLTKGYTLVRRERMLMLINLEDGIPPNLVPLVPKDQIDKRGEFELISVLFDLEKLSPDDAELEVKKLLGPQGTVVVLPSARQIQVIETAGRLRAIRTVLERMEDPTGTSGGQVRAFDLKHAVPANVMDVLRQLLDIPPDKNSSADGAVHFALDAANQRLLVSGRPEKLTRVEEILKAIDIPTAATSGTGRIDEAPQLEVYAITAADPDSVLKVMQTLLTGLPDVRLAIDPKTGSLVAFARPSQQATIRATLEQLQHESRQVEVIPLRRIEPQVAVLSINKLFSNEAGGGPPPQVDADPATRQLLVRGTKAQIEQIHTLLEKMGEARPGSGDAASGGNVRMLPLSGRNARLAIERIQEIWPALHKNKIRLVTPSASSIPSIRTGNPSDAPPADEPVSGLLGSPSRLQEIRPSSPQPAVQQLQPSKPAETAPAQPTPAKPTIKPSSTERSTSLWSARISLAAQGVSKDAPQAGQPVPQPSVKPTTPKAAGGTAGGAAALPAKEPAPIIISPGPGGILIASEDVEALNEFEQLLTSMTGGSVAGAPEMTIFYLKNTKAAAMAETLDKIFGGGTSTTPQGSPGGSMLGDLAGAALGNSGGGILGSLLGLGGEGSITPTGPVKITPDSRLNALLVQANAADIDNIEQLLRILDQKESPEEVLVAAKPKIIPVHNTLASDVAEIVKQVYHDRMAGSSGAGGAPTNPMELFMMMRAGRGMGQGQGAGRGSPGGRSSAADEVQKMSIGVDARANSLIVVAPESLFLEVKQLVEQVDTAATGSSQSMRVVTLRKTSLDAVQQALSAMIGEGVQVGSTGGHQASGQPTAAMRSGSLRRQAATGAYSPAPIGSYPTMPSYSTPETGTGAMGATPLGGIMSGQFRGLSSPTRSGAASGYQAAPRSTGSASPYQPSMGAVPGTGGQRGYGPGAGTPSGGFPGLSAPAAGVPSGTSPGRSGASRTGVGR